MIHSRTLWALLGLIVQNAVAADSVLIFNELHYHPANEAAQTEWIELRSLQAVDVDIGGWKIDGGIDYTFPNGTIMPGGGYLVVAAVPGQIPGAVGPFTGQLSNGGETLRLRNRNGRIMDVLEYDDEGDWPVAPDGGGVTLARRRPGAASGPSQWSPSSDAGGTPGAQNFSIPGAPNTRTRIIPVGATWRFLDDGTPAPLNWTAPGFDDSTWKSGATLIAGGGAALAQARPTDIPTGLLAYWPFDETSGTTADNKVVGQVDGTMANGAAFVTDPARGQVASFDGTDDRVEMIDTGTGQPSLTLLPAMTDTNDFTWAAWVWSPIAVTASDQSLSVIMGNRGGADGADTVPREYIRIAPTNAQYHRNASTTLLDYPDLATSTWTHMCVVKRGLNLDYYRNGVFVQTVVLPGAMVNTALPFFIGGDRRATNPQNEHFQGRIDDVALWTRALSAAEIGTLGSGYGAAPPLPAPAEQTKNAVPGPEPRYFRKTFNFAGTPARTTLELWPVADDGAIVYLNGTEIWRSNVPVTNEVTAPAFTSAPIIIPGNALVKGTNVLSAEVHQHASSTDLLFGADLLLDESPNLPPDTTPTLVFSEISGASDANFFVELQNKSGAAINIDDWVIRTDAGESLSFPDVSIPPGGFASFTAASLGLVPADGMRLTLFGPDGTDYRDAREITNRPRGLTSDGRWGHPSAPTPGAANTVTVSDAIVINEIFYNAPNGGLEQWVELHNRSAAAVDVSLWKFSDGIDYQFPPGTPPIAPGEYVVIAWDPTAFAALHPGVTAAGPFTGTLSGKGELLTLRDQNDNVVDQLRYSEGGRWSSWADGGGSSLELRDPDADNSIAEAWEASDESGKSSWQNVSYSGLATNGAAGDPATWNEFVFGLLAGGEFLIDDISVKNVTLGNVELIQNGTFSGGTAAFWRVIGTHLGTVVDDPTQPGNKVLKVSASGTTEHMHNHAGTTLKNGGTFHTINGSNTYAISFRAKWLRGSNRLHSRLYCNRLPRQTLLNMPTTGGTPGAVNSVRVPNIGPTFQEMSHSPTVPAVQQAATVRIRVADPDGVQGVTLFTSINGAAFTSAPMTTSGDGIYQGAISGQGSGAQAQFYVAATDTIGGTSFFPPAGPNARAMVPWTDGRAQLVLPNGARPHNIRVIITSADATELYKWENLMSNQDVPCTVILDEQEVYYHVGVRLKSSEHGRYRENRVGYLLDFGADEPFLGTHTSVSIDRSGGVVAGQREILLKTASNVAGGIHASEDDIVRVIAPVASGAAAAFTGSGITGAALLSKTRFNDDYLDNQWDGGGSAPMFKYERVYVLTQTINPTTRVVDAAIVPENPKIPQDTTAPPGVAVTSLGADKELYRWYWLIENGRNTDDYSGMINVATAVGQVQGSAAFNTLTAQHIDIDTWLRANVPSVLYGVVDNYLGAGGGQHNALVYFPPGKKAVLIPWDLDFLNQTNAQASLTTGGDVAKFIANPVHRRAYYGHMLDVLNRTFNATFLTRWAQHYSRFGTDDMTTSLSYLTARAQYARDVINGTGGQTAPIAPVAFTRTSASPTTVSTPFATVSGDGWINVAEIRLQGSTVPLAITWMDENSWSLQLPVNAGTNTYTLVAYDRQGAQIGTTTVTVTGSGGIFPAGPGNLVVSELNYNPAGSTDATEFVELLNITNATLDLSGCHFDEELGQGIAYLFPTGVQVPARGRILIVRDTAVFTAQYGAGMNLAPGVFTGALDNSGESLVLYTASGVEIFRFSYGDEVAAADGGGKSLVRVLSSTNPNPADYTWRASVANEGNPNTTDAVVFTGTPLADVDGDGSVALMEYAFGTSDSNAASRPPAPNITFSNGTVGATYALVPNADDVVAVPESTANLTEGWQAAPGTVPAGTARFFRLKVMQR